MRSYQRRQHKQKINPRGLRRICSKFWIVKREQEWDLQNLCRKGRTHLRLKKDHNNVEEVRRRC
jgi:hypothetical protein